ncbi:MAG: trigger factor, partial [Chloroflexi bacterium]|nr:trigger factor [Chloroflexota bacterium]
MKVNQEEVIDRQTVLNIELEDEDLDPYLDRGYRRVVQRTVIPGFRKGKAPRRIVENFLGRESLLNEVLDSMLPEVTSQAIDRQELEAAGLPRIELLNLTPLTLKATVPLKPEIDLGAYREIRIDKDSAEVSAEDVQERLEQLQHSMASWEPVERAVKMGDMVTMEATGTVDERPILTETDALY